MAKNIAENHRLTNQNAQYDIGSNILQRTPGGRDHTVLLTDLQKIQLKATAFGFTDDADYDGILDGNEMGTYKQVDITKFVEHMLKAESGLSDVSALMENYRNNIRAANADPHKQNLVETQKDIDVDFWGNIKVMLMSYTSNPILKDTDFDGIDDGFGYQDKECTTFVNKNADFVIFDAVNGVKQSKLNNNSYKLVRMVTFGNLYIVATGNDEDQKISDEDMIVSYGEGLVPDLAFKAVFKK